MESRLLGCKKESEMFGSLPHPSHVRRASERETHVARDPSFKGAWFPRVLFLCFSWDGSGFFLFQDKSSWKTWNRYEKKPLRDATFLSKGNFDLLLSIDVLEVELLSSTFQAKEDGRKTFALFVYSLCTPCVQFGIFVSHSLCSSFP